MKNRHTLSISFLLLCLTSFSTDAQQIRRCSVPEQPREKVLEVQHVLDSSLKIRQGIENITPIEIPIAFHIIRYDDGTADVTDQQIEDQVDVLNASYTSTNFQFSLHSIERVDNSEWADQFTNANGSPTADESAMKNDLADNPAHLLNFYTVDFTDGTLGIARFPWDYPEDSYMHGVICDYATLPGGSAFPYDEGDTGTHEIGHWIGLWHTFQGGCAAPGDDVDDTPYEAYPAYGCPQGRDTCPDSVGNDPVTNFMDYTDDACMDNFTPGQADRMDQVMAVYRPSIYNQSISVTVDQKLADGQTRVGTIGHWDGIDFEPRFSPPKPFGFTIGEYKVFHGDPDIHSNQKYNRWNNIGDVTNHHVFEIQSDLTELVSNFSPTHSGVTIKNNLIGAPGIDGGEIKFKDPWLIDYADPLYANNERNRGMNALLKSRPSPFTPDYSTSYDGDVYQGVFLNQGLPNWNPPFYSVQAIDAQQITVNGKDITYDWESWSYDPAEIDLQSPTSKTTAVVFKSDNATLTANMKGRRVSDIPEATFANNGAKLTRHWADATTQKPWLVYEDRGNIYTAEQNNAGIWQKDSRLAAASGSVTHHRPAVTYLYEVSGTPADQRITAWESYNAGSDSYDLNSTAGSPGDWYAPDKPLHPSIAGYRQFSNPGESTYNTAAVAFCGGIAAASGESFEGIHLWFTRDDYTDAVGSGASADFPSIDNREFRTTINPIEPYYMLAWQENAGIQYREVEREDD